MTPSQTFAAAHLAGVAAGIIGGTLLPWWQSGGVAWTLAGAVLFVMAICLHRLTTIDGHLVAASGAFWGAFAGALAADSAEVLDAVLWPGHDATPAVLAAIGVSLAWALAAVTFDGEPRRPWCNRVGLALYLLTAALSFGPAIIEVWS